MRQLKVASLLYALMLISGCKDAPRDNPLDPSSPQYTNTASVKGQVLLLNQNSGIVSASISSLQDGVSVSSDADGNYSFNNLTVGTQTLVCTKENFVPDTQQIILQSRTTKEVLFELNGAPYVLTQNILTRKIDQYYPSTQYFVDVTASVSDPNGMVDVDSVWFTVDTLLFPMDYSVLTKQFQITIYKYDLPTNTIQWLVNKPLRIRSKDRSNAVNLSTPFYVSRIVENLATPTYPTINTTTSQVDTTGSTPLLQWLPPDVTFNYTYTLTLSRVVSDIRTVVWTSTPVNSSRLQLQFPADSSGLTLSAGEYVWTISVVDDFGNYSRSKEAPFVVQ
ncbi:MAG: carboxypeptidase regulatory-like domain-containing protein [Bacteroidota bacterium]